MASRCNIRMAFTAHKAFMANCGLRMCSGSFMLLSFMLNSCVASCFGMLDSGCAVRRA